ncbi:MAG: hypothetical protein GXO58_02180 [Thermodesulfobacteria bacterium]|nr:hypothetical protein [Thermodesulfobacteriota bacterium]
MVHFFLTFFFLSLFNASNVGACTMDMLGFGDELQKNQLELGQQANQANESAAKNIGPYFLVTSCFQTLAPQSDINQSIGIENVTEAPGCFFSKSGGGEYNGVFYINDDDDNLAEGGTNVVSDYSTTQGVPYDITDDASSSYGNGNGNSNGSEDGLVMVPELPMQPVPLPPSAALLAAGLGIIIFRKIKHTTI